MILVKIRLDNFVECVINGYFFILSANADLVIFKKSKFIVINVRFRFKGVLIFYINIKEKLKLNNSVIIYN